MQYSLERFLKKVSKTPDGCWDWTGHKDRKGYGVYTPKIREHIFAHRLSYIFHVGPIPEGLYVLHSCDRPPCVNPAHLRVGTGLDNIRDRQIRGRGAKALTEEKVRAIRLDPRSQRIIARDYGVDQMTIGRVKARKTWPQVK